jgi:hypothetical protein
MINTTGSTYDDMWSEVRLAGKLPERRSNHCSFIVKDYLYIHGGRDIKEGPMPTMWRLSISSVKHLEEDPDCGAQWEVVNTKGVSPGKISHHTAAVIGNKVLVFGGIKDYDENSDIYEFDPVKLTWSQVKSIGDIPKSRDDHSLSQIDQNSFLVFGGFVEGSRVNECYVATKKGDILEWKQIGEKSPTKPCSRASHSTVVFNNKCYIYGGHDDDNNKLNDIWELDLQTELFTCIELSEKSETPAPRSGHTCTIYNGKMYIFGGILELTKELNQLLVYDFATKSFSSLGGNSSNEEAQYNSQAKMREEDVHSPTRKNHAMKQNTFGTSPNRNGRMMSPSKLRRGAPNKSPCKKKDVDSKTRKETGLASPTSISMQNSFIIKNADDSFDAYYMQMKKRKNGHLHILDPVATMTSSQPGNISPHAKESHFGVVQGIHPAARDGHSANITEGGLMFVFGGDRHHMPFNDLYLLKL